MAASLDTEQQTAVRTRATAGARAQHVQQESASSTRPAAASWCCAEGGLVAVPAASNFAAFSHGMGWLLRSGVAADVALVLELPSSEAEDDVQQEGELLERQKECTRQRLPSSSREDSDGVRCGIQQGSGLTRQGYETGGRDSVGHPDADQCAGIYTDRQEKNHGVAEHHNDVGASTSEVTELQQAGLLPQAPPPRKADVKTPSRRFVFPAHSLVLGARSEKFAAMLRFVRRQDAQCSTSGDSDSDSYDIDEDEDEEDNHEANGTGASATGNGETDGCFGSELAGPLLATPARSWANTGLGEGQEHPEETLPARPGRSVSSCSWCECCRAARRRKVGRPVRVRRWVPRELELRSPLLSPRSLGLFLEFCYTGVLDPSLSAAELSELALLADEYLVPELALQVESLLVETLVSYWCGVAVR